MSERCPVSDWNPIDPATFADYPSEFRRLRGECPVAYSDALGGFWSLLTYDHIAAACKDPSTFSSEPQFSVPHLDIGVPWLPIQSDPPRHATYRKALASYLGTKRVKSLEPAMRDLARKRIDALRGKTAFDAAAEFTMPYPGEVLCMALGFPEEHWEKFRSWTTGIAEAASTGDMELLQGVVADLFSWVAEEVEVRKQHPGDDLMSTLLALDVDGRPLTLDEMRGYYFLLTSAGHDTSSNSLGQALLHLAQHPEDRRRLLEEPELVPGAVEEIIRYYSPLLGLGRQATRDVELGGREIKKGDPVALVWGAAARDDTYVADADQFVLDRKPYRHISFGLGSHYCVGAELGRSQLKVAVEEFLETFPDFSVDGDVARTIWPTNGIRALPLSIG